MKEGLIKGRTTNGLSIISNAMSVKTLFVIQGYDSFTPVTRVIDGGEPMEFRCLFKNWKEKDQTTSFTNKRRISGKYEDIFIIYLIHLQLYKKMKHNRYKKTKTFCIQRPPYFKSCWVGAMF